MTHFLDWLIPSESERAREISRRRKIGLWGRLREDAPRIAWTMIVIAIIVNLIFVPWLLGFITIYRWIF